MTMTNSYRKSPCMPQPTLPLGLFRKRLLDNGDQDEGDESIFDDVYYLKMVHCSQKLLSLHNQQEQQGPKDDCTVGELLFLDESCSKPLDFAACASIAALRTSLSQRPSLWSFVVPSKKSSKIDTSSCCNQGDVMSCILPGRSNFSCCPPEVNFRIFSFLPQAQILECRRVCLSWCTQINFFFGFHSVLSSSKLLRFKPKVRKPLPFEIVHYDLVLFTHHLKHKDFLRLPEPRSIRILKKISSKNFLKLIDCWRHIESLTLFLEPLSSVGLFEKWTYYYPLEYFPELTNLTFHLDRLHLERYKSFNPKQLRFNLDQILMNPYTKLETFTFHMLNSGRHFACAFLAPILMFIGRHYKSLRKIDIAFHTGYELDSLSSSYATEHHAPCFYVPLEDQLYVHGEINLTFVPQVKLTHCSLALPSIIGCTTKSGICNYFSTLLASQKYLRVVQIETQTGVDPVTLETIVQSNKDFLQELEVTIALVTDQVFDMASLFAHCVHLKSLRVKRVGYTDLPNVPSQIVGLESLPPSLIKISLQRFYISIPDLYFVQQNKPNLQCLCVCCCYINVSKKDEPLVDEAMSNLLLHDKLKFVCFAPIRRNTLNRVITKLKTSAEIETLMSNNGWFWSVLTRELWLAKPRRLILHKGEEWCTRTWFSPYYYEKVKV